MGKVFKSKFMRVITNKYFIVSVFFLCWLFFWDENSIVSQIDNKKQLEELQMQKEYYEERIASDKQKLEELNKGKEELEKFAREQYNMSKPDEDVFVIVEEKEK